MAVINIPCRAMNIYDYYSADDVIPLVFGYGTVVRGLRKDPSLYVVGEGSLDVLDVRVGNERVDFESLTTQDEYNKTITLVKISPVDENKRVAIRVNGLRSGSGGTIFRPSEVIKYLLDLTGAGDYIDLGRLVEYEIENDIQVRGIIRGGSLRKVLTDIVSSIGCFWAGHFGSSIMPLEVLYNPIICPRPIMPVTPRASTMRLSDVVNVVEFKYDYNDAISSFMNSAVLTEEYSLEKYKERRKIVESGWIYRHKDAIFIAREMLRLYAFPQLITTYDVNDIANIGEAIRVGENDIMAVIRSNIDLVNGVSEVEALKVVRIGDDITERITTRSIYEHKAHSVSVTYQYGVLTVCIVDDDSQVPVDGAIVTIDDTTSARTNPKGEAYFTNVNPGKHTIKIEKFGYETLEFSITI